MFDLFAELVKLNPHGRNDVSVDCIQTGKGPSLVHFHLRCRIRNRVPESNESESNRPKETGLL
jgi:hypothetical protein